ncbi:MAG: hypothetical protein R3C68_11080 [Myxococcota bacterium]
MSKANEPEILRVLLRELKAEVIWFMGNEGITRDNVEILNRKIQQIVERLPYTLDERQTIKNFVRPPTAMVGAFIGGVVASLATGGAAAPATLGGAMVYMVSMSTGAVAGAVAADTIDGFSWGDLGSPEFLAKDLAVGFVAGGSFYLVTASGLRVLSAGLASNLRYVGPRGAKWIKDLQGYAKAASAEKGFETPMQQFVVEYNLGWGGSTAAHSVADAAANDAFWQQQDKVAPLAIAALNGWGFGVGWSAVLVGAGAVGSFMVRGSRRFRAAMQGQQLEATIDSANHKTISFINGVSEWVRKVSQKKTNTTLPEEVLAILKGSRVTQPLTAAGQARTALNNAKAYLATMAEAEVGVTEVYSVFSTLNILRETGLTEFPDELLASLGTIIKKFHKNFRIKQEAW